MIKNSLLLLVLMMSSAVYARQTTVADPWIDSYIKHEMKEVGIPGMAVAVARNGKVLHCNTL